MARPVRGGFESWLRGGQTIGHTIDMTLEVMLRLGAVLAVWAILCAHFVNRASDDAEQYYGWLVIEAKVLGTFGHPLPQSLSVKSPVSPGGEPDGPEETYPVKVLPRVDYVQAPSAAYFRRAWHGLILWFAGVILVGVGTLGWYTTFGRDKMKARQIRGQEVCSISELITQIDGFNHQTAKERGLEVMAYDHGKAVTIPPTAAGRSLNYNPERTFVPARLVGVPYPFGAELEHTLTVGSPGSGKTVAIHRLIDSIRSRGDRGVIYDPELEFIAHHFDPATDTILNPFDERSVGWSPFYDAKDHSDWNRLAHAVFKDPHSGDPYWTNTARQLFSWTGYCLQKRDPGITLLQALDVLFGPTKALESLLEGTPAAKHLAGGSPARVSSLESVMTEGITPLIYLHSLQGRFSIRDWVNNPIRKPGFLFLSAPETHMDSLRPLLGFWAEIVVSALLSRHDIARHPTWVVLDEFPSLGKIDKLADGPQRLRKYGGAIVLGMQQISQLKDIYGADRTNTIVGQCATKLILRAQDPETAEFMSQQLGRRVMRRVEENTSYGANSIRDGVGLTPREELEPVVLAEDVMNFPKFTGMIRVNNARKEGPFPIAPLRFEYIPRPKVAPAFVARTGGDPVDDYLAHIRARKGQASSPASPTPGPAAAAAMPVESAATGQPPAPRLNPNPRFARVRPSSAPSLGEVHEGAQGPAATEGVDRSGALAAAAHAFVVAWSDAKRLADIGEGPAPHHLDSLASTGAVLASLNPEAPAILIHQLLQQPDLAQAIVSRQAVVRITAASPPAGEGMELEAQAETPPAAEDERPAEARDASAVEKRARKGDLPTESDRQKVQRESEEETQRQRRLLIDRLDPREPVRLSVMMKEGEALTELVAPSADQAPGGASLSDVQLALEQARFDPAMLGQIAGTLFGGAGILDLLEGPKRPHGRRDELLTLAPAKEADDLEIEQDLDLGARA